MSKTGAIPEIYIHIPHYEDKRKKNRSLGYVDRGKLENRIANSIKSISKGGILVTGYRGVGKSTIVHKATCQLLEEEEEKERHIVINVSLGKDSISDRDLLVQIVNNTQAEFEKRKWKVNDRNSKKECLEEKDKSNKPNDFFHFIKRSGSLLSLISVFAIVFSLSERIFDFLRFIYQSLSKESVEALNQYDPHWGGEIVITVVTAILLNWILSIVSKNITPLVSQIINKEYQFLRKLKDIQESIQYEVNKDSNFSFTSPIRLFTKKSKTRPIASVKEIEEEIIQALQDRPLGSNKIVYVLDELDKIELHENTQIQEKESEEDYDTSSSALSHRMRLRQDKLFNILGNLKYFFTEAEAKFIFITGRQMYDAWLAGIADRNNFLNSIFGEMIYVNSFYRSDKKYKDDIFKNTEKFLVTAISERSLKKDIAKEEDPIETYINTCELSTNNADKPRLKYFLYQFVFYLAYRSNGVPQKLNTILLNHTDKVDIQSKSETYPRIVSNKKNGNDYYLRFDFYRQYKVCFGATIFKPFVLSKSSFLKLFEDKMIVSTGFLLDHLFKFHEHGFSFRALELTPEIISVNKAPELRRFIQSMVAFLENNHIKRIENGLFEFKFLHLTHVELVYISKISENNAAAYNFTLDESLTTKRHYYKKLHQIEKRQTSQLNMKTSRAELGFIHRMLGDLHFYDKEYDEAIINYTRAYQEMLNSNEKDLAVNNSHYLFGDLSRQQNLQSLKEEGKVDYNSAVTHFNEIPKDLYDLLGQVRYRLKLALTFERTSSYDAAQSIYRELMDRIKNYADNDRRRKIVRTQYILMQPFMAYAYVSEKISYQNTNKEINYVRSQLFRLVVGKKFSSDHFLNQIKSKDFKQTALFVNRIGDLLFFRNGNSFLSYLKKRKLPDEINDASWFYLNALSIYVKGLNNAEKKSKSELLEALSNSLINVNENFLLKEIADSLSDFGNSWLYKNHVDEKIAIDFLKQSFPNYNDTSDLFKNFQKVHPIFFILLSSKYYKEAGVHHSQAFQLKKILVWMLELTRYSEPVSQEDNFLEVFSAIAKETKNVFRRGLANTEEIENNLLDFPGKEDYARYYEHPDVREIQLLVEEFELIQHFKVNSIKEFDIARSIPSSINLRIRELIYQSSVNIQTLKKSRTNIISNDLLLSYLLPMHKYSKRWAGTEHQKEGVVSSIFCLTSAIQHIEMIGQAYPRGVSELAITYLKLALWIDIFFKMGFCGKELKKKLRDIDSDHFYTKAYCLHKAEELFENAVNLQQRGKEYYDMINEMYYLEDDFNNDLFHFSTTIERHRIQKGHIAEYQRILNNLKE